MDYKYHQTNDFIETAAKKMSDEIMERLILYRKRLGLTQQDIADATGMQCANIARMESRKNTVAVDSMMKYAKGVGVVLGFYTKQPEKPDGPLPLPIGVSDFRKASTEYYYIDKTLLIKKLIDDKPTVSLFTRPRGFGKTLNMDMLRLFFEKTEEDTSIYFDNRLIWLYGDKYRNQQLSFLQRHKMHDMGRYSEFSQTCFRK